MRRKDREIKDTYGIREIIRECDCCRLAFPDGKSAYIVPLSFGYDEEENALYFHGAAEGKKMDLVRQRWTLPMALRRRTRPADIPSGTEAWWGKDPSG